MGRLLFLGDFFFDYYSIPNDINEIAEWISNNEYLVILNLEGSLSNNGNKIKKRGPNLLHSSITINILKRLNVVGVCLANNHIMDYGEEGLKETLNILKKNNILYTGAGMNLTEALEPIVLEIDGQVVYIQNYGWDIEETIYATDKRAGCAPRKEKLITKQISKYRDTQDAILINIFHWSFEYNLYPMPLDIDLAHKTIDAGCDLIIGHHPHNIQPKEKYNGKFIYYSLGNFYFASKRDSFNKVFPSMERNKCDYGAMIVYDTNSYNVKEYIVKYNRDNKMSIILLDKLQLIEDITKINYLDTDYINKAKDNRVNINPILTLDNKLNFVKLRRLSLGYKIAGLLRIIRKIPIGEKFYQNIKKIW